MKSRSHDEAMAEYFRADPAYAINLLTETYRNGDAAELAILLRQMAEAFERDEGEGLTSSELKLPST